MPGYRKVPAADPTEQKLREAWYNTTGAEHERAQDELAAYIWKRTQAIVAEDRKRHPKAKRNQTMAADAEPRPGGRYLP